MITFIPPRLRKPAMYALAGLLFAGAWLVHGGRLWWVSISAVILTVYHVIRLYRLGELGVAVLGHPPHHRLRVPVRPRKLRSRRRGTPDDEDTEHETRSRSAPDLLGLGNGARPASRRLTCA